MKKKILMGAIGLASVFTLASATDGGETDRKFWGSQIVGVVSCVQGNPGIDGSPTFTVTYNVEYYVLWIGIQSSTQTQTGMPHCEVPTGCISC